MADAWRSRDNHTLAICPLRRNGAAGMHGFEPLLASSQGCYCKAFQNHSPATAMMASKMSISGRACGLGIVRQSARAGRAYRGLGAFPQFRSIEAPPAIRQRDRGKCVPKKG
jgi:hypothetical protein